MKQSPMSYEVKSKSFFIKRTFLLCICIMNILTGVFNIKSFFSIVVNILCFHAFFTVKWLFFPGTFLYKTILEPEKSPRKYSLKMVGLYFYRLFISRTFFHWTFLVSKFRTAYFRKLFFKELDGTCQINRPRVGRF